MEVWLRYPIATNPRHVQEWGQSAGDGVKHVSVSTGLRADSPSRALRADSPAPYVYGFNLSVAIQAAEPPLFSPDVNAFGQNSLWEFEVGPFRKFLNTSHPTESAWPRPFSRQRVS